MNIEILCEGYHDRSFWSGMLQYLDWNIMEKWQGKKSRQYGFDDKDKTKSVVVTPCEGKSNIGPELFLKLRRLETNPINHLIVNIDPDGQEFTAQFCKDTIRNAIQKAQQELKNQKKEPFESKEAGQHFQIKTQRGATQIHWVVWGTANSGGQNLPTQQTLERMICAAILEVYPDRAGPVNQFLTATPLPPGDTNPKSYAWSFMAKWAGESGCDRFYQALWEDEQVRESLKNIMTETGAWQAIENCLS